MIKESNDGRALIYQGESGPVYTASKNDVMLLADRYLPSSLAHLTLKIHEEVESFHYLDDPDHKGDISPEDIHSGLEGLIVLSALAREHYLLSQGDGTLMHGDCRGRRSCWVCTLPTGHGTEHIAHVLNETYDKASVCDRWPEEEDEFYN